jgi:chemotaxis signal transduction protein
MAGDASLEILCFRLGGILWGVEADQVDRIARPEESLESRMLDPARALGVGARNPTFAPRLILRLGCTRVALPVDEVLDLVPLSANDLAALPPLIAGVLRDGRIWAVGKMGKEILLLLDVATLCGVDAPVGGVAGTEVG